MLFIALYWPNERDNLIGCFEQQGQSFPQDTLMVWDTHWFKMELKIQLLNDCSIEWFWHKHVPLFWRCVHVCVLCAVICHAGLTLEKRSNCQDKWTSYLYRVVHGYSILYNLSFYWLGWVTKWYTYGALRLKMQRANILCNSSSSQSEFNFDQTDPPKSKSSYDWLS